MLVSNALHQMKQRSSVIAKQRVTSDFWGEKYFGKILA